MNIYNFRGQGRNKSWLTKAQNSVKNWPWQRIFVWAFRAGAVGVLILAALFVYYSKDLPNPNRLLGRNVAESTKIYARDGSLLYEIHGEVKRTLVNLDQISPDLVHATLAAEDQDFYNHSGISIRGILRSLFVDIIHLQKKQGGSTITQQFVKNAILTNEKSAIRKVKEIILSIEIEARFSKDDILKLYLNEIPYGRNAYGIEAASQTYFNKSAKDLTLAESAYLAALPQAPSYYNPSGPHFDDLQARQRYILSQMKSLGSISEQQYNDALNATVTFSPIKTAIKAPHFVLYVQDYLASKYGEQTLQEGGLKVYTTLDPKLQDIAEQAVKAGAEKNAKYNGNNAALVAMDPKTGQILAMVGSKDYFGTSSPAGCIPGKNCLFEPNVNVATSLRQPGSSFKPYAYVTAFGRDFKYAPASMLMDVNTDFGGGYRPKNFNLSQNGPVSMRKALAGSLNIPAVKTLALVGVDNVTKTARDVGITSKLENCGLALVLGGCEVKLIDHVNGYATLAAGGVRHDKTAILKVLAQDGQTLEEYQDKPQTVLDPQAVYLLTNIMSDNAARSYVFGANSPLTLGSRPVAAKTGTTQDFRDGWTVGFTPSLVAGVWTGNNSNFKNTGLMKQDAVVTAGPIWNAFMKGALKDTPIEQFTEPAGITKVTVDSVSGKLPTVNTPETKTEVFADYSVPTSYDSVHVVARINTLTGQPADDSTPPELVQEVPYTVFHSERPDYAPWEQAVIAWALANGYNYPPGTDTTGDIPSDTLSFNQPSDGDTVTTIPFTIGVAAPKDTTKVDISVNGELVQTLTSRPFSFLFARPLSNGKYTLKATAYLQSGKTQVATAAITVTTENTLSITDPSDGSLQKGDTITAHSNNKLSDIVTFYLQKGNKITTLGPASDSSNTDTGFDYSLTLESKPTAGNYQLYAKSGNLTSDKVSVTIK